MYILQLITHASKNTQRRTGRKENWKKNKATLSPSQHVHMLWSQRNWQACEFNQNTLKYIQK